MTKTGRTLTSLSNNDWHNLGYEQGFKDGAKLIFEHIEEDVGGVNWEILDKTMYLIKEHGSNYVRDGS